MERELAPCRILVVEDDQAVRMAVGELLAEEGYDVVTASNGATALAILQEEPLPVLVVLDLMMPELNGWEFHLRMQQDARLAEIPVVVLSAVSGFEQRRGKLDVAAILSKPVDLSQLLQVVARYCLSR